MNHQQAEQGDRLSWGDTVFLHLEREDMPLNVACVCVFEGKVAFPEMAALPRGPPVTDTDHTAPDPK